MKALIEPSGRVAQVAQAAFPVAPPLKWVEAPEDVTTEHRYESGAFIAPEVQAEPGPRAMKPARFIRRLRDLGKFEAALAYVGGPESPDFAELVSADWISEADPRVVAGLEAVGVGLEEMFGK